MLENREVLDHIAGLCDAAETGTLFITTGDNRACHVLIEQGRITALSFGPIRGEKVFESLNQTDIARYAFKTGIKMPLPGRAYIDESVDLRAQLTAKVSTESETTAQAGIDAKKIYRGASADTAELANAEQPSEKKSLRLYRGHKLTD